MQEIPYDVSHTPIDYDGPVIVNESRAKISEKDRRGERREQRVALEKDIVRLQKKLMFEVNMRNALNRGLSRPLGSLPRIYASLPLETRELLLEVAVLEEEIMSLEKQAVYLEKEILSDASIMEKELIYQDPHQMLSPEKLEILVSTLVSSKDSARIFSKPSLSPRKSIDQENNISKPLLCVGRSAENKSSPKSMSIHSRNSVNNGSPIKSPASPCNSSDPRRITTTKHQSQRNSLFEKTPPGDSRDLKSRKISPIRKEHHDSSLFDRHTAPLIPMKPSAPKVECTSLMSPLPVSPCGVGKCFTRPSRVETGDRKPPVRAHAQSRRNCMISNIVSTADRTLQAPTTPRPMGDDKGRGGPAKRSPRQSRQPLSHGTPRTIKASAITIEQKMDHTHKTSSVRKIGTPLNCESRPKIVYQNDVSGGACKYNLNHVVIPNTKGLDEDDKSISLPLDLEKPAGLRLIGRMGQTSQLTCSLERNSKLGLEHVANSILLSEQVVKLLKTIYTKIQENQPPLASDFNSSSQASVSTNLSSASLDDCVMRGSGHIKLRLDDCHTETLSTKTSATMNFMRYYYSGEVGKVLDPYSHLSGGNMSNRVTGFASKG
ncbi:uncharacterized protein [Physcomitrium patens]|uniref:Ternary complex factor MIP1 leucine-zipper domain-containing protein n=1 Tax=Physcomitrium patens TaxID=3218 RepID=A0A7I4BVP4_PHYPA|nr:uncharacterized protein LOC112281052 isoform X1 [Physcomitrium patens]XP_024372991.1 uncharacterized protein LOC112281052 isoform X1 [Physcomitrium patens]|eukprot:XP_024372982.1 uncharacterized protein LOC112281052 isoform X1 [Physcomitrella patens]